MTEHPIIFSAPMVRALREGRKTQTRRTRALDKINKAPDGWYLANDAPCPDGRWIFGIYGEQPGYEFVRCPYGVAGDRLYSRETWAAFDCTAISDRDTNFIYYRADDTRKFETDGPWKPSIHMPRWASRDTLEITSVRPERLQAITEEDAIAEGALFRDFGKKCGWTLEPDNLERGSDFCLSSAYWAFANLWNKLNGPGSWAKNPWVWRVEYRRLEVSE